MPESNPSAEGLSKSLKFSRRAFLQSTVAGFVDLTVAKHKPITWAAEDEHKDTDWTVVCGIDTAVSLEIVGPYNEHITLGKKSGSLVLVDSLKQSQKAESISGRVNDFRDYQGVYKSSPGISSQLPEGFHVNVIACHTTPGWPGEPLKKVHVGETLKINGKGFLVSQRRDMNYQQWNDARGQYEAGTHPYFQQGEVFFRLFGSPKSSFGFNRTSELRGYEALVLTSCEGKYVGGEVGHEKRFALLLKPAKQ